MTKHLEDAHHVMGLKPKLSEGSTKSSDVDNSKNCGPALSDDTSQSSSAVTRSQSKDTSQAVSSDEIFLQSSVDDTTKIGVASKKTGKQADFFLVYKIVTLLQGLLQTLVLLMKELLQLWSPLLLLRISHISQMKNDKNSLNQMHDKLFAALSVELYYIVMKLNNI